MWTRLFILALVFAAPAHAEVFKCKSSENKTIYQTTPCAGAGAVAEKKIEIKKRSPEKEAEEAAKLEAWTAKHNAEEEKELAAAKERRVEELRAAEVESQRINASAQLDQAEAQRRQAEALKNLNRVLPYPGVLFPPHP